MQIRVIKADGQVEPYLHTKVLGTFHNALGLVEDATLFAAEQLAEAVTFYLYQHRPQSTLSSDEIHLMVASVLSATGFANAAEALNRYRLMRQLKRRRIEVIGPSVEMDETATWNKSRLADSLARKHFIDALTARAIAATVEEKVLAMKVTRLRKPLLNQLILNDVENFLDASRQLETVTV